MNGGEEKQISWPLGEKDTNGSVGEQEWNSLKGRVDRQMCE